MTRTVFTEPRSATIETGASGVELSLTPHSDGPNVLSPAEARRVAETLREIDGTALGAVVAGTATPSRIADHIDDAADRAERLREA